MNIDDSSKCSWCNDEHQSPTPCRCKNFCGKQWCQGKLESDKI